MECLSHLSIWWPGEGATLEPDNGVAFNYVSHCNPNLNIDMHYIVYLSLEQMLLTLVLSL